jgi:heme-degrading monooxygenase HmoA
MILEIANLTIVEGRQAEFEDTFVQACELVRGAEGFHTLELQRSLETPNRYALLVVWDNVEDHTEKFRGSDRYQQWRALLHGFFDGPPDVAHFRQITTFGHPQ